MARLQQALDATNEAEARATTFSFSYGLVSSTRSAARPLVLFDRRAIR